MVKIIFLGVCFRESSLLATFRYTVIPPLLINDDDQPLIPYGQRHILVYGVLEEHFLNRNTEMFNLYRGKFKAAQKRMAGEIEQTTGGAQLIYVGRHSTRRQINRNTLKVY